MFIIPDIFSPFCAISVLCYHIKYEAYQQKGQRHQSDNHCKTNNSD